VTTCQKSRERGSEGTEGSAGTIPGQVAAAPRGCTFANFDEFATHSGGLWLQTSPCFAVRRVNVARTTHGYAPFGAHGRGLPGQPGTSFIAALQSTSVVAPTTWKPRRHHTSALSRDTSPNVTLEPAEKRMAHTTDELIDIVRRLQQGEGTDEETLESLAILTAELPDPAVSDLIFYRDPPLTAEDVVAEARRYRPIEL
jgi:hypothetical protein